MRHWEQKRIDKIRELWLDPEWSQPRRKNASNLARKRYVVIQGQKKSISEWAKVLGFTRQWAHLLWKRGKLKEEVEEKLSTYPQK